MLKIGHRGARAYEPENTLRSFSKALELGVDAVELDARVTKDGDSRR
jgi:glycerophosphoryl diester phosphodiesterase